MSRFDNWFIVIGALLVSMALVDSLVKRMPFTPTILYLGFGYLLGTAGTGLHPRVDADLLRILTEVAMAISLFAVGLKLRAPLSLHAWRLPLLLALPAMVVTILVLAVAARLICDLPWNLALVLAATLAPTDPVLGSDVQVEKPGDGDVVRFSLTGEGGLNDGLAAPAVALGLALVQGETLPDLAARWFLVDTLWFTLGGIAIGALVSAVIARLVLDLRRYHAVAVGMEDFLGFGVIGLAFGLAGLLRASEFLAVFAAGVALRHVERRSSLTAGINPAQVPLHDPEAATDPDRAAVHMTHTILVFNAQAEHIAEFTLVTVLGGLLSTIRFEPRAIALAAALFLVARPAAVAATLAKARIMPLPTAMVAWFGIRGIGSLYYLAVILQAGIPEPYAGQLTDLVLTVVALSIVIHGISATPLMDLYGRVLGLRRR